MGDTPSSKPKPLDQLPETLRQLRIQRRLTQKNLATAAGVKFTVISNYERSHTLPRLDSLERILIALGLTLSDLGAALDQIQQSQEPHLPRRVRLGPKPQVKPSSRSELMVSLKSTLYALTEGLHQARQETLESESV